MTRFIISLLLLCHLTGYGQEYSISDSPLVSACGGFFTDSGGLNENYGDNENLFSTICKNSGKGTHIRLTFSQIDLSPGDELCFFDGLDISAPQIACASDYYNGYPFILQATAANTSGCLTVWFQSNNSEVANGWEANIDCIPSCQLIQASLRNTVPVSVPSDTGWIDICPGDRIFFEGESFYPQNGLVYEQSDASSSYEWNFGDGTIAHGKSVSHVFQKSGGFRVSLTVSDQYGCTNANIVIQRVRVATRPNFELIEVPDSICLGEAVQLSGRIENRDGNIVVSPTRGSFLFEGVRSDSLALPDGNGTSYQTSIRFRDFIPGQVLTKIEDLRSICVDIEHSWLHDMEISISCPSGKTVILQQQKVINEEVYLGIPNDNDDNAPREGSGAIYCWTPSAINGTFTQYSQANDNSSPSKPYFLPAGNYNSFEPLENLLGCPLNGDWTITVTDLWGQDNGYIFSWSIDIDPGLYPDLESFLPEVTGLQWEDHPDIINPGIENITIQGNRIGESSYTLIAEDNFGCLHDSSIQVQVLPANHPKCLDCEEQLLSLDSFEICESGEIALEQFIDPDVIGTTTFKSTPNYSFSFSNHPNSNPYEAPLQVSNIPDGKISTDAENLISVCIDVSSDYNADLTFVLISPNGVNLILSAENGGSSKNYSQTCFKTTAALPIEQGTGPFTGSFQPDEPFSKLEGSNTNGVWKLRVSDDAGLDAADVNVLNSWSMTFKTPDASTFEWSPSDNLSCSDCPNPIATLSGSQSYVLTKSFQGCVTADTLLVTVLENQAPTVVTDISLEGGSMKFSWQEVAGADYYEVSLNNGTDWTVSDYSLSHLVKGVQPAEDFLFLIRAVFSSPYCISKAFEYPAVYNFCDLSATLTDTILTTSCADVRNGQVRISATGGLFPYTYRLNDSLTGDNNLLDNLGPGNYMAEILDATSSCADTLRFQIQAPPPLNLSSNITNVTCNGEATGAIRLIPEGGVGNYQILNWSDNLPETFELNNLQAGNYAVTISDENNCLYSDTIQVTEPALLETISSQSPVLCYGEANGQASIKVKNGSPPYSFLWETGDTESFISGLSIGIYQVTVTDKNNCQSVRVVTITQPEEVHLALNQQKLSCPDKTDGILQVEASGGTAPFQYQWSTGQNSPLAFNLSKGTYSVTAVDNKGCQTDTIYQLSAPEPLIIDIRFTPSACSENGSGLATATITGGTPPYQYRWNDQNNQTNPTATDLTPGNYQIQVSDSAGCTQVADFNVLEVEKTEIASSVIPPTCHGGGNGSIRLEIPDPEGYSIFWNNGDTTFSPDQLVAGIYNYTIKDRNGCQFSDSIEVIQPDMLTIDSISAVLPNCAGFSNGSFSASVSGGMAPYSFIWNGTPGSSQIAGLQAGSYTLRIADSNDCLSTIENLELTEPRPLVLSDIHIQPDLCNDEDRGAIDFVVTGGTREYSYSWSNGSSNKSLSGVSSGRYLVSVTDENGCLLMDSFNINALDALSAEIETQAVSCFGSQDGRIEIKAKGGQAPYTYSLEGNDFNGLSTLVGLNQGFYSLTIKDFNDCVWEKSVQVETPEKFDVKIETAQEFIDLGDSLQLSARFSNNNGNIQYSWQSDDPASFQCTRTLCRTIFVKPLRSTSYDIYAIDENGCEATDQLTIYVRKNNKVFVPTAFSPNGDGVNDRLIIHGNENIVLNSFRLYDRWGEMVFSSTSININDPSIGWDGTFRGEKLNAGVFTWIIDVTYPDGEPGILKGHTTLIR